jgi:ketosteroid isomerase-like protein
MSVNEIQVLAQQFADAFDNKNIQAVLDMLSDDVEVFDHVPYRFDDKKLFSRFLSSAAEGIASMNFGFRQPSCRVFNGTAGIVNAYDTYTGVTKDGKVQTIHGRTTLVFVKEGGQWKIVSAHFSALPHASYISSGGSEP